MLSKVLARNMTRVGARGMASHWESMAAQIPSSKKEEFSAILSDMRKAKMNADGVAKTVAPIDWAHFKTVLPAKQVDQIEAEFKAVKYTDFNAEATAAKAALQATVEPMVAQIKDSIAALDADAAGAKEQIELLTSTLTTFDTKLDDVLDRNPELDAKFEAMIANNEWDPEMANEDGVSDPEAQRAALLRANWDESTMGPFDESVLNAALSELRAIDETNEAEIESRVFGTQASLADAPAELLAVAHEAWTKAGMSGSPNLDALAAEAEAASTLSEAELAETSEAALWSAMNEAEASGNLYRANLLMDLVLAKGADGSLELADDEFMANELAALTEGAAEGASAAGIPATSADLEGDAATLKAAAAKAEAAGEYRRAAEILMKSGVTVDAAALKMKAEVDTL